MGFSILVSQHSILVPSFCLSLSLLALLLAFALYISLYALLSSSVHLCFLFFSCCFTPSRTHTTVNPSTFPSFPPRLSPLSSLRSPQAKAFGWLREGQEAVIVAGIFPGVAGTTNMLKLYQCKTPQD